MSIAKDSIRIANQTTRGIQLVEMPDDWDQEHVQVGWGDMW